MVFIPLSDDNPLRSIRFQWVTIGLIALNVAVFLWQAGGGGQAAAASFALVPSELFQVHLFGGAAHGQYDTLAVPEGYTLLTYMFLHGDIIHLASNMLFLWVFGDNVEDAMGHAKFLVFYIVCGIAGALAHAYMLPTSALPLIGASGAVAGVIAAYLILHPRVLVWVLVFRFLPTQDLGRMGARRLGRDSAAHGPVQSAQPGGLVGAHRRARRRRHPDSSSCAGRACPCSTAAPAPPDHGWERRIEAWAHYLRRLRNKVVCLSVVQPAA